MQSGLFSKAIGLSLFLVALFCTVGSNAFVLTPGSVSTTPVVRVLPSQELIVRRAVETNGEKSAQEEDKSPLKSEQEIKVYDFLKELSDSNLSFRIVVVGNGAILESTNPMGPTFKVGESPKTGASIVTFASEDQSFEFHLMPAQIASAVLVDRPRPDGTTMRILRLLNGEGGSVCSLIVVDNSSQAETWYDSMTSKYGSDIQF